MSLGIPKILGHIWIGHRPAPLVWLQSWRDLHPDWEYRLYDNAYLFGRRWRNQPLINEYYRRGIYAGVSDIMRYEILHEIGGFIPEADSKCLRATDALWDKPALYTVYENEERKPGLVSPFLASAPGHPFLDVVSTRIKRRNTPETLGPAWRSVGNRFLKKAIEARNPDNLVIFPSHYFIPTHKKFGPYAGDGPVYCEQHWGSTFGLYDEPEGVDVDALRAEHIAKLAARLEPAAS
ncbi:MAG: hypothetical protein LJE68_14085 [Rhodobacter sp.]|nr:hypothetical protein [Rhodobacter sp.]